MIPIGIDLGTTFSAVATLSQSGKPVIVKNSEGESTMPSVIFFPPQGAPVVGAEAKAYQAAGEVEVASFFKTNMGDAAFFVEFHGTRYSAIDLSAILLRKLKSDAEENLGQKIEAAVITVPAYFNNMQREATIEAAKQAGLKVLRIVNEPTAAAIAYGLNTMAGLERTMMIYDLGGGTFDVSLVRVSGGNITVLATDGDHRLGGKNWDDRVAQFLGDQFKAEHGQDPFEDKESFNDLMVRCEKAKRELSAMESTKVSIIHGGEKGTYLLSRATFSEITRDLLEQTEKLSADVLKTQSSLTWQNLDGILLVGGSTRMPMVAEFVEAMTGKPPVRGINVDEAVALGAALQAALDIQAEDGFTLEGIRADSGEVFELPVQAIGVQDVIGHSLGMVAENADRSKYINSFIIKKNTTIPCNCPKAHTLRVGSRGGELEVYMLQGENDVPLECTILGKYVFSGVEATQTKQAVIDVAYAYNRNGVVEVSATQRETGKTLPLRIEPLPEDMSWLALKPSDVQVTKKINVDVAFFVDTSGSMSGDPMKEAKKALQKFVDTIDLSHFRVAIGMVADWCSAENFTAHKRTIDRAIDNVVVGGAGGGNSAEPFSYARKMFDKSDGAKFIVVLTDGVWSCQYEAEMQAKKCKDDDIEIIAIGFGGADHNFLKKIATCDENALLTDLSKLVDSFSKIAQVMSEGQSAGLDMPSDSGNNVKPKRGFFGRR